MIWLGHSKIWRTETVLSDWEKQERSEGGRRGGGGGCVLGGRDLLWEETRTQGAGKQKLGHMEKSSCNDPTLGPAHRSHVCLSSCLSVHHLWSFVKLLCPFSSPETAAVCLHLYVFDCFSSLASLMDPVLPPVSEINRLITSRWKWRIIFLRLFPPSNLDISNSDFTLNWITLFQEQNISLRGTEKANRPSWWHIQSRNRYSLIGFTRWQSTCVWRSREGGTKRDLERREELPQHFLNSMKM